MNEKDESIKNFDELPLLMTVGQMQKVLNVSRVTAYNLIHRDDFYPAIRIGRCVRVVRYSLQGWIEQQATAGNGER